MPNCRNLSLHLNYEVGMRVQTYTVVVSEAAKVAEVHNYTIKTSSATQPQMFLQALLPQPQSLLRKQQGRSAI